MKKIIARLMVGVVLLGTCCVSSAGRAFAAPSVGRAFAAPPEEVLLEKTAEDIAPSEALQAILSEHEVMALIYQADAYPLRAEPSYDSETLAELATGQTVFVRDAVAADFAVWIAVEAYVGGQLVEGYVPRGFLACSDERFLNWEQQYPLLPETGISFYGADDEGTYADVESFPSSYRGALYALKREHPQWTFVKMDVGLDWKTVLENELKEKRSLIYKTYPDYMRGDCYDDGNWYYAKEGVLAYYLDPRNGLTEEAVFQFELLTYNETYHTEESVDGFLKNTFMTSENKAPGTDMSFAQIFWAVGKELNVSPFHLAARVYQEQQNGTSPLISGTYSGYEGYYNYFNIKASGTTTEQIIVNGLEHAKTNDWNSAYYSILGGANVISANYIQKGQDTLYLQKFNVNRDGYYKLYTHQYMQNIVAPSSEGKKVKSMYEGANSLGNTFVFKIPVYDNMPASACPMPTEPDSNLTNPTLKGWVESGGYRYWYEDGVKQGTEGRGKEIYDPESKAWYWLDGENGGRMTVDKDVYMESAAGVYADRADGTGKWVRYDVEGHMVKGEDFRYGGWYRFDEETGAMVKGWYTTEDGRKYYYDKGSGQMAHGQTMIDGVSYYFDYISGVLADFVWVQSGELFYWYENGARQGYDPDNADYRGKEIYDPKSDAWYWLDNVQKGARAVNKDVYQESEAGEWGDKTDADGKKIGKWVRYDGNGHMVKGWQTTDAGTYYFDPVYGTMAKGRAVIGGQEFYFDEVTGVMR